MIQERTYVLFSWRHHCLKHKKTLDAHRLEEYDLLYDTRDYIGFTKIKKSPLYAIPRNLSEGIIRYCKLFLEELKQQETKRKSIRCLKAKRSSK